MPNFTDVFGQGVSVPVVAMPALNIDCSAGVVFTKTISANSTFTVSNVPPAGTAYRMEMIVTNSSGTIALFSGVIWPGGMAPTLTAGLVHRFLFETINGGTTWRAACLPNYAS